MSLSVHLKKIAIVLLCQYIMLQIAISTVGAADNKGQGFIPELLRVEISSTVAAPGGSIEMSYYCRNSGTQPAINNLMTAVKFRNGDMGFFNADGGGWFGGQAGQPFQNDFYFSPPTTLWEQGMVVVNKNLKVNIPADVPDGNYAIIIWMHDRGGRVPLGALNDSIKVINNNCVSYKIGSLTISKNAAAVVPAVWNFSSEPNIIYTEPVTSAVADIKVTRPVDATLQGADKSVVIGDKKFSVSLDKERNYALSSVCIDGTVFESGGKFPAIAFYDRASKRSEFFPDDPRWVVTAKKHKNSYKVVYSYDGFEFEVTYTASRDGINVSMRPIKEQNYKALLVSSGGSIITIPADKNNAVSSGFILAPSGGGALIEFPTVTENIIGIMWQGWTYPASFLGFGYNGRGLIVRCPQYGCAWSYGTGTINNKFSLAGNVAAAFRPSSTYFDMPLPEPVIELQLVPVRDTNKDSVFNWVDIGVKYRNQFIKRNANMDYALRDSVLGKIDTAAGFGNTQNYSQLIEQIRTIDFAPQTIWLVGAHPPPAGNYVDPPYSEKPDPSHNGDNGYDYFAFKRDAEKIGARVGIHELFQDASKSNYDWDPNMPLKLDEYGNPKGTWGGTGWHVYAKALNVMLADGSFQRSLDKHLKNWDVRPGDTWHWDCLSAMGGQQDYSPVHPATNGTDTRDCIKILKYIKSKGIHMTSEGLQEGMSEFCDIGWSAQINLGPPWGGFQNAQTIPLTPVLFQGMTYYCFSWRPAYNLLYGGKGAYESTKLGTKEAAIAGYFSGDVFWRKIADRTVQNMIKTEKGWRVEYTQGGSLDVDLANMSDAMTFVLNIDGETFTPDNPPPSSWGVKATRVDGKFNVVYPKGKKKN